MKKKSNYINKIKHYSVIQRISQVLFINFMALNKVNKSDIHI